MPEVRSDVILHPNLYALSFFSTAWSIREEPVVDPESLHLQLRQIWAEHGRDGEDTDHEVPPTRLESALCHERYARFSLSTDAELFLHATNGAIIQLTGAFVDQLLRSGAVVTRSQRVLSVA